MLYAGYSFFDYMQEIRFAADAALQATHVDKVLRKLTIPSTWKFKVRLFESAIREFAFKQVELAKKNAENWGLLLHSLQK